ncbi:MAG: 50S ribosomal protein L1 [Candidatus Omnitrophica bacterium]|nr:50S ribosomal protein L1 [Candidatus Omnitrophota bacterium]
MRRRSRRYKEIEKLIDKEKLYSLKEAVALLKEVTKANFDTSLDLHLHLGVDPKRSEQMVRGTVLLPHGTGKKVRIAVFAKGEEAAAAKDKGADFVGAEDLIQKVAAGFLDFERVIATPEMMKTVSRLGKILGPRGLMPSPKTGTVTNNVAGAIEELKKGKVEFKVDKLSGIHLSVGRISFAPEKLLANISSVIEAVKLAQPEGLRVKFIKRAILSSTMNPGLSIII